MVTINTIKKDYKFYIEQTQVSIKKKNRENAYQNLNYAAMIAYKHSFQYFDQEAEGLLDELSEHYNVSNTSKLNPKRCVFYDDFGLTHRMLSKQYIHALIQMDFEILVINSYSGKDISPLLKQEFESYKKIKVITIPSSGMYDKRIQNCIKSIEDFSPKYAFLQMKPGDIVGNIVWRKFTNIERYYINTTDHTFWLGKNCFDYILEFRSYGYNISLKERHILKEQCFLQPYYPIFTSGEYQGMANENSTDIRLFSGGQACKIYDEEDTFLNIVKAILQKYPKVIFYYAGNGSLKKMKHYIKKNHLEERWFLLGERSDIYEVISNIDIFLNTYPVGGGLLVQMAAMAKKPIISFFNPSLPDNRVDELFIADDNLPNTMAYSLKELLEMCGELINDEEKRKDIGKSLYEHIISEKEFRDNLASIINYKKNKYKFQEYPIDTKRQFDVSLEAENGYLHDYPYYFIHKSLFIRQPIRCILSILRFLVYHVNRYYLSIIPIFLKRYLKK